MVLPANQDVGRDVHEQYARLYDSRIESYLKTHGVRLEEFYKAVETADAAAGELTRREDRTLYSALRKVHDPVAFRAMMVQRALEMDAAETPR